MPLAGRRTRALDVTDEFFSLTPVPGCDWKGARREWRDRAHRDPWWRRHKSGSCLLGRSVRLAVRRGSRSVSRVPADPHQRGSGRRALELRAQQARHPFAATPIEPVRAVAGRVPPRHSHRTSIQRWPSSIRGQTRNALVGGPPLPSPLASRVTNHRPFRDRPPRASASVRVRSLGRPQSDVSEPSALPHVGCLRAAALPLHR